MSSVNTQAIFGNVDQASARTVKLSNVYGTPQDYQAAIEELQDVLPAGAASVDVEVLDVHGRSVGQSKALPATVPSIVVFPKSTEDVVKIVNISRKHLIPIIPYSGATSLERHHIATDIGGICVDLSGMNKILEIHEDDGDLVVQAGARWVDINQHLKEKGIPLFIPLDPGLGATIGGMMSTGCSGTNAVRYGTAKGEWFLNATVVLPSGEVIKTRRRSRKCAAGFDSTHVFIGAEGTLGIITEATVRLAPVLPTRVIVVQFPSVYDATKASTKILNYGVGIQCIELLDALSIHAINKHGISKRSWPEKDSLFFKIQGPTPLMLEETAKIVKLVAEQHGGTGFEYASTEEEAEELWSARKNALFAALALTPNAKGVGTDVCVPVSRLPDLVRETKADFDQAGIFAPIIGHVGDGNFHAMLFYNTEEEGAKVQDLVHRMVHRAIALDGTCTGEHGVGLGKRKYLYDELGHGTVNFMKSIKNTIDPLNLFNPGKLYPE